MALAIGDFDPRGEQIIIGFADKGGPIYRDATEVERLTEQFRKNGFRTITDQVDRAIERVGGPDGAIDIDIGTDSTINGIGAFENLVFDASPLQSWGAINTLRPNERDSDGNLTYVGYQSEAVNVITFHLSAAVFDFNGQPTTDNPYIFFNIVNSASENESTAMLFKMRGDGFEFDAESPFDTAKHARLRPKERIDDLAIGGVSSYLRKFSCRPVPNDPFDRWQVEIWHYFGNTGATIQISCVPLRYEGTTMPAPVRVANTAFYEFPETPALVGARLMSQYVVGFGDRIVADPTALISGLAGSVSQVRAIAEDAKTKATLANAKADSIAAKPGAEIGPKMPIIFDKVIYSNETAANATLPDPVTETWLLANGFVKSTGGVLVDEVFTSNTDADFLGKKAPDGADIGINITSGRSWYIDKDRNWTPAPAIPDAAATKWNFTSRNKIPPIPFLRNHGKAVKDTSGSILADEGRIWSKTDANVFDLPNLSFSTSPIVKGKDWIVAAAVKTVDRAASSLTVILQPNGGTSFGADLPDEVDGDWTVIKKAFNVPLGNINTFFQTQLAAPAGDVQGPVFYEKGKDGFTWGPYNYVNRFQNEDGTYQDRNAVSPEQVEAIKAKLDALSPLTMVYWATRSVDPPMLVAPNRAGASFSELRATLRDGRPNVSGGYMYPDRSAEIVISKAEFIAESLAGWSYQNAKIVPDNSTTIPGRKTFFKQYTWAGVAYWFYIQWERAATEWRFWIQGWHSAKWNEYTAATSIEARYAVDSNAVDPALAPLLPRVDAEAIYAKKTDLAIRTSRQKVWTVSLAGLTVTGGQINDNTAANLIPLEADLSAPVFSAIVSPGPATVRYQIAGLTVGQRYEFIIKEGIALASAITVPGNFEKTNTPDWRVFKQFFTATKTTEDGQYTLSGSANIHGPAVYSVPGTFVHDKDLNLIQVAELQDIPKTAETVVKAQNSAWFDLPTDTSYERPMPNGAYTSLYVEFSHPADAADIGSLSLSDFITGFSASGFYGTPTRFINTTMPISRRAVTIVISRDRPNTGVLINIVAAGNIRGRVRNVILNGTPADTVNLSAQIAENNDAERLALLNARIDDVYRALRP